MIRHLLIEFDHLSLLQKNYKKCFHENICIILNKADNRNRKLEETTC